MKTVNFETKTIKADCDVFIIPNSPATIGEILSSVTRERYEELCKLNKVKITDKDKLVQVWITSEDLHSDNLSAHGFTIKRDKEFRFFNFGYEYIPELIIRGKKEGEVIEVTCKTTCEFMIKWLDRDEVEEEWTLHLRLKLNQLDYRYRRFGRFEDVLQMLV